MVHDLAAKVYDLTAIDNSRQRQFMKALKSGRFGQGQAHSLAMVIFG
jgi:hypothetical protein